LLGTSSKDVLDWELT